MLDGYVSLKHAFADDEHRRRFRDLIVDTMNRLARTQGREAGEGVSYQGPSAGRSTSGATTASSRRWTAR